MTGVQNNEVVQTLSAYGSDQALHVGILPGTLRRREYLFNPQRLQSPLDFISESAIPIPDQIAWRFAVSERLDNLLCNPSGCWVIGHVEVEHFAPAMLQHEEHKQDSEPDCRNSKEVHRRDLANMIAKKRFPGLRRWWPPDTS
jgi:hypothetical protein